MIKNLFIIFWFKSFDIIGVEVEENNLVVDIAVLVVDTLDGFHNVGHLGLSYHDAIAWQNREVIICMHDAYELSFSEEDSPAEEWIGCRER